MNKSNCISTRDIGQVVTMSKVRITRPVDANDPLDLMQDMVRNFRKSINRYDDVKKNCHIYSFCDALLYKLTIAKTSYARIIANSGDKL